MMHVKMRRGEAFIAMHRLGASDKVTTRNGDTVRSPWGNTQGSDPKKADRYQLGMGIVL